jgi:hypothetical protein
MGVALQRGIVPQRSLLPDRKTLIHSTFAASCKDVGVRLALATRKTPPHLHDWLRWAPEEDGLIAEACDQLRDVQKRVDGQPRPPDFVTGADADELLTRVQQLRDSLGCS